MTKVIQERSKCIGCGSCVAICPKYWGMEEDGKARLKNSIANAQGDDELEVKKAECNQEAADSCPVQIIHIILK